MRHRQMRRATAGKNAYNKLTNVTFLSSWRTAMQDGRKTVAVGSAYVMLNICKG